MLEYRIEGQEEQASRISFGSAEERANYIRNNQDARAAGSRVQTTMQTRTDYVWRNHRSGSGTFTGEIRQHTVPAQTRTLREYATQVRRTQTVTETVRKPYQRTIERTVERTVTQCNRIVGCYESTVRDRITETITQYRNVTTTREEVSWEQSTYWSTHAHSAGDSTTGRTRQVVVQESRQIVQYQFAIQAREQVTRETFFAVRSQSETTEGWEQLRTVEDQVEARKLAKQEGIRIGEVNQQQSWVVASNGSTTEVVSEYEDSSNVVETVAFVTGEIKERRFNPVSGETEIMTVGTFREEIRREGNVDIYYLVEAAKNQESDCSEGEFCEN